MRMQANLNPKECVLGMSCAHRREHAFDNYGCPEHGCIPVAAESPRIDALEESVGELQEKVSELDSQVAYLEALTARCTLDGECKQPAEPEQYICENAGKCKDATCLHYAAHTPELTCRIASTCRWSGGISGSMCITTTEYAKRKAAAEQAAKAAWDREAVKGATVELTTDVCEHLAKTTHKLVRTSRCTCAECRDSWITDTGFGVGPDKARVIAPPKAEMQPEVGDKVRQVGWSEDNSMRVLCIFKDRLLSDYTNTSGEYPLRNLPWIIERPALVPGEPVMHREHKAWGAGVVIGAEGGLPIRAYFPNPPVNCEYDLSKLARVAWLPELHKGEADAK